MYWVIFMSHPAHGGVKPKGAIYDNMWNSPWGVRTEVLPPGWRMEWVKRKKNERVMFGL